MARVGGEWRTITHLYAFWSRELGVWEKYRVVRERQKSVLLSNRLMARKKFTQIFRNYRPTDFLALVATTKKSPSVLCLPGDTSEYMTEPWLRMLRSRGVDLHSEREVLRLEKCPEGGWNVVTAKCSQTFDAVILTLIPAELDKLLSNSAMAHNLPRGREDLHFKVVTLKVDGPDPLTREEAFVLRPSNGVTVFLQRPAGRGVAFCTSPADASVEYILAKAREICGPEITLTVFGVRLNEAAGESIYASSQLLTGKIMAARQDGLFFAGSAMRSNYRFDSGEAAARSARNAVDNLLNWRSVKIADDARVLRK
jgi:hypothetical protein